ncbi:glycosyltransferase [Bosea sp. 2YAB26]|uniref:glycosyltransferase n=1 Tax=Bosea sp. 2YAB26 TaxID=3237478 RepID=UPI003F91B290
MSVRLSCVIATRNAAHFFSDALQSITPAVGTDADVYVEILVADGGSTDDTLAVASADPRVRIVSERDSGIYDGMNRALAAATGDFVLILNSDDLLLPNVVGDALAALADEPDAGWLSAPSLFGARLEEAILRNHPSVLTSEGAMFGVPAINGRIFRRVLLDRLGPIRTDLGLAADREFMVRVGHSGLSGLFFGKPFYFYRIHESSHTISGDAAGRQRVYQAELQLARKLLADPTTDRNVKRLARASGALARMKLRLTRADAYSIPSCGSLLDLTTGLWLARRWRGRLSGY